MDGLSIEWGLVAASLWLTAVFVAAKKLGGKWAVAVGVAGALAIGGLAIAFGTERCRSEHALPPYAAPSAE